MEIDPWILENFRLSELACKCCGGFIENAPALILLQSLRKADGRPMVLTSAYRCPIHNKKEGGGKRSQHLLGTAFDIALDGRDPEMLEGRARMVGFTGIGRYPKKGFIHVDLRETPATWGTWNTSD